MGHYSKKCPNLPALPNRENVRSYTQRFFINEKGKVQVHLIEQMSEGQEKVLKGLKRSFKILDDVINVMAQTKRSVEDIIHSNASVKKFKEMA
jgi:hypothetical protein